MGSLFILNQLLQGEAEFLTGGQSPRVPRVRDRISETLMPTVKVRMKEEEKTHWIECRPERRFFWGIFF